MLPSKNCQKFLFYPKTASTKNTVASTKGVSIIKTVAPKKSGVLLLESTDKKIRGVEIVR
jgi:hypothetical protein